MLSDLVPILAKERGFTVEESQNKVTYIYDQIREITANIFHSFKGEFSAFMPLPNAFELYGCDFLVDEDFSVYFLEANPGPDMKLAGDRLEYLIEGIIHGMVDKAVIENPALRIHNKLMTGKKQNDTSIHTYSNDKDGVLSGNILIPKIQKHEFGPDRRIMGRMDCVYSQKWHASGEDGTNINISFN